MSFAFIPRLPFSRITQRLPSHSYCSSSTSKGDLSHSDGQLYFSLLWIILASTSTPFRINGKFAKQPTSIVTATGNSDLAPIIRESSPEPDQHISPILPFPFSDMSDNELNTPAAQDGGGHTPVTPQANNLAAPPAVPFIQAPPLFAQPPPLVFLPPS
ncbi:hypothetical protein B0H14DRAFT_3522164 [Mycena olivaceomarginata]|nr:hypothetical protein B0H14DRAFT_3522164 [Mycena olivaceomarginata]